MNGTIIHGTLRPQDLVPVFTSTLHDIDGPTYASFLNYGIDPPPAAQTDDSHPWWETEDAVHLIEVLMDMLSEAAPEGTYFGAHEGDGSDFGFWRFDDDAADLED